MLPPINLPKWLAENADKLKPPIGNFCLYDGGDFTVMVVGGPNSRSQNEYHLNETEEFFYQYKGRMTLKILDNTISTYPHRVPFVGGDGNFEVYGVTAGEFKEVEIGEGEMFLLPPNTPHNPCRYENTVGLVIERVRPLTHIDRIRWYCPSQQNHPTPHIIHEVAFHCSDLGTQLAPFVEMWMKNESTRKCHKCGTVASPV